MTRVYINVNNIGELFDRRMIYYWNKQRILSKTAFQVDRLTVCRPLDCFVRIPILCLGIKSLTTICD